MYMYQINLALILFIFLSNLSLQSFDGCKCEFKEINPLEEIRVRQWARNKFNQRSIDSGSELLTDKFLEMVIQYVREGLFLTDPAQRLSKEDLFIPENLGGYCILAQTITSIYLEEIGVDQKKQILLEMGDDFGSKQVHAFVIVELLEGQFYLLDPTFAQFFNMKEDIGSIGNKLISLGAEELAINLCSKGYSKVDDVLFRKYLEAFSVEPNLAVAMTLKSVKSKASYNERRMNRLLFGDSLPKLSTLKELQFRILHQND